MERTADSDSRFCWLLASNEKSAPTTCNCHMWMILGEPPSSILMKRNAENESRSVGNAVDAMLDRLQAVSSADANQAVSIHKTFH